MALYIGLMSGTSADAIDAALVDIEPNSIRVTASTAVPIPDTIRAQILALFDSGADEIERLGRLDRSLGELFAETTKQLLSQSNVSAQGIRAIGSHGQTLRHRPRPQSGLPFTLQIGDPNTIAERTGITTVADFRRRDVACGGQGAPLTPAFHQAVFADAEETRGVLNIGGIANLTVLAPNEAILGFDTGPGNGLMDAWIQHCQQQPYDRDGCWAASGSVHRALLAKLRSHPYFALPAPKSTGREEFTLTWLRSQLQDFEGLPSEDVQATLAELTAVSVSEQINRYAHMRRVYVCGGGAYNGQLLARIRAHLPNCELLSTDALGIPPSDVEAAAFAWLAHQTINGLAGNLPSVTGASRLAVLGGVFPAGDTATAL